MSVHSINGEIVEGAAPGSQPELVRMLRTMLEEAEAGRLVVIAGVVGAIDNGRLSFRFATVTPDWEIHDRVIARVGILRNLMERDYLDRMTALEGPLQGGDDPDDAA